MGVKKVVFFEGREYFRPQGVYIHGRSVRLEFVYNGRRDKAKFCEINFRDDLQETLDEAGLTYKTIRRMIRDGRFDDAAYASLLPESSHSLGRRRDGSLGSSVMTFYEVSQAYLQHQLPFVKRGEMALSTYNNYKKILTSKIYMGVQNRADHNKLATRGLKSFYMREITPHVLENLQMSLCEGRTHKTVNTSFDAIRAVTRFAHKKLKIIPSDPCIDLTNLRVAGREGHPEVFTDGDLERLWRFGREHDLLWLIRIPAFGCWSGLRVEELLGLAWEDVEGDISDPNASLAINIRRAHTSDQYKSPKTRGSVRRLVLLKPAADLLRQQWLLTGDAVAQDVDVLASGGMRQESLRIVFQNYAIGGPIPRTFSSASIRKMWKKLRVKSGVDKQIRIARHTYASRMISAGQSMAVVAADLGHSSTQMIERHYGGIFDEYSRRHRQQVLDNLGELPSYDDPSPM